MKKSLRAHPAALFVFFLCLAAFGSTFAISIGILEGLPHIEDEIAYDWQARVIARGRLTLPSPQPCPKCFLTPFVIDYQGIRFGKYPPGWPALLAAGHLPMFQGFQYARNLINPALAGCSIWLIYLLIQKVVNRRAALLAVLLTVPSPFFLMNSASLLSHAWALFLTLSFCLGWLDAFTTPNERLPARIQRSLPLTVAALSMGVLALTRPMSAVAVAGPFGVHALYLLAKGPSAVRLRILIFGAVTGAIALLVFVWQFAVTGDPFLNPYLLWWPYDKIGFGPGVGLQPGGYMPGHGIANTQVSLQAGANDLFGWMGLSWLFMPLGILAIWRNPRAWLVCAVLPALIGGYFLYWMGSWLVGPRYYYEGLFGAVLLTSTGILCLGERLWRVVVPFKKPANPSWVILPHIWKRPFFSLLTLLVCFLLTYNLAFYLPFRLAQIRGLYGITRACYWPFQSVLAQRSVPALVIVYVQHKWIEYGCMLDLSNPFMDSDFVFIVSHGSRMDQAVAAALPGRKVLYYYPETRSLLESRRGIPKE